MILHYQDSVLAQAELEIILSALQNNEVHELILERCIMSDQQIIKMTQALIENNSLQKLDLTQSQINSQMVVSIAEAIKNNRQSQLKTVNLTGCNYNQDSIQLMQTAIKIEQSKNNKPQAINLFADVYHYASSPDYQRAQHNLLNTLEQSREQKPLFEAGLELLYSALRIKASLNVEDQNKLIRFMDGAAQVINNPSLDTITLHKQNTQEAMQMNYSHGKLIGGAMLLIAGLVVTALTVVIVGSIVGAAVFLSAGTALLHIDAMLATLGGIGLGVGFGVGMMTSGSSLMSQARDQGELALNMEHLTHAISP